MYLLQQNLLRAETCPRLALTLGDPAGIGPEVILKALAKPEFPQKYDVTVVGSKTQLLKTYEQLRQHCRDNLANPEDLKIIDINTEDSITTGIGNAASGAASFAYLQAAIARTQSGEFEAIVTGPIAKSAWKAAGYNYPGQTELLAQSSGVTRYGMLFVARSPHTNWTLRTLLATTHIPLRQVADTLTPELLANKLDLLVECLQQDFGIEKPRIAIAGLNPHSGESGQLGREEQDWLIPWLEKERCDRPEIQLDGPIPPDTMWVKPSQAWYGTIDTAKAADAYLALYHDQGLIPVKQLAFDRAVNTSIGLSFVRTSPDHGTAFDIAGKGIADATSMKAAIQLAAELACQRSFLRSMTQIGFSDS
ncbi:4-hydroxythreonine-4-phosphate dehydrogenase PdxA [Chroococcidiopsis sp. TS-821]|uniref:4-hydroxythreonine-4-phosphate dehydrogenase PdxA n=1 Tax=Chroococcidiopsis sp. TS-821 TaxID=1378066 RepID=UPI000CEE5F69|nr:4-hydroxythreonine-4-phosphate dehydrogenase PdxA [Chroococcidiopsis sp. TS-821]PPS43977.1 4-hydroxythreonine-4-phosphate dehydrogenase PdxA [Chroococcidiopsis sp. TS-821]